MQQMTLPITLTITGLLAFGLLYAYAIDRLKAKQLDRGYTAIIAIGGIGVTIVGAGVLIGQDSFVIVLACFAASGIGPTLGSIRRYVRTRQESAEFWKQMYKESKESRGNNNAE